MNKVLTILVAFMAAMNFAFAAIDINTATQAELDKLPGIGPVKAKAIVEDRAKNGPFKSIDDLKRVKGIGGKTFDELKGQISVGGSKAVAKPAGAAVPAPATGKPAAVPTTMRPAGSTGAPIPAGVGAAKPAGSGAAKPAPAGANPAASLPAPAGIRVAPAPAGARGNASEKAR
jgi:competence protein ComEA